ncbi:MAG TPA: hypothetical protein VE986_02810 [Hyphomicrobiales bacterium]|nr:hypothetical protein [Hyphomicrobiales bacterium]
MAKHEWNDSESMILGFLSDGWPPDFIPNEKDAGPGIRHLFTSEQCLRISEGIFDECLIRATGMGALTAGEALPYIVRPDNERFIRGCKVYVTEEEAARLRAEIIARRAANPEKTGKQLAQKSIETKPRANRQHSEIAQALPLIPPSYVCLSCGARGSLPVIATIECGAASASEPIAGAA